MKFKKNREKYKDTSCWKGSYYTKNSDWQYKVALEALNFFQIPNDAKVLDIGCGDGKVTKHLASLVNKGEILGLDLSASMLKAANANNLPNLSFVLGDAMKLPFKNQFDRIVAFNSLHWVPEISIALENVRNALVPGGQVLILVAPIQVRHPIHKIINEVAKRECWAPYFRKIHSVFSFYTLAEWAALIEESKMIPESLKYIDASKDYPNKKAFADFVGGWIPFGTIPENKRRRYVLDVVEAYITITPCNPSGAIHYYMDELVIIASKPVMN